MFTFSARLMERLLFPFVFSALTLCLGATTQVVPSPKVLSLPPGTDIPALKETTKSALAELMNEFAGKQPGSGLDSFVILPLARDIQDGYFTRQFENVFAQAAHERGLKLYTREDQELAAVMKEPEFARLYADAIDFATIEKLSLSGAQAMIIPRLDVDVTNAGAQVLSVSISVHRVSDFRKLWGSEVSKNIPGRLTPEQIISYVGIGLAALGALVFLVWIKRAVDRARRSR